ncbi:MAG: long-chain fatty acid--CoA ligase [Prevotella sp.]|nr:long-chain fatty acid--CoA ligase [Prevotella sp.]
MKDNQHPTPDTQLPIPLLGESWESDFCLYTTGTTGKSKGVVISQKAVISNSENLIAGQGFTHDLVFVIAGSMKHLGCWSKIFPVLMLGATIYVIEDGMKDIDGFFKAFELPLEKYSLPANTKFATFLVPSNIRILLQFASDRLEALADRMDFLETGAAPMPHSDMLTLCKILPKTRLYNTYASTETGVVSTYNYNDGECIAGCLGHALPHSQFLITPEGRIACKGDTLMTGYKDEPELTRSVLHDDTLFTADNGYIDEQGRLHILGRDDDTINTGGFKVAPSEVEDVALSMPDIDDCICISQPHPVLGNALALLVVLRNGAKLDKRAIALHLSTKLKRYQIPLTYKEVDKIQRTFNGKLNRKYYKNLK